MRRMEGNSCRLWGTFRIDPLIYRFAHSHNKSTLDWKRKMDFGDKASSYFLLSGWPTRSPGVKQAAGPEFDRISAAAVADSNIPFAMTAEPLAGWLA